MSEAFICDVMKDKMAIKSSLTMSLKVKKVKNKPKVSMTAAKVAMKPVKKAAAEGKETHSRQTNNYAKQADRNVYE